MLLTKAKDVDLVLSTNTEQFTIAYNTTFRDLTQYFSFYSHPYTYMHRHTQTDICTDTQVYTYTVKIKKLTKRICHNPTFLSATLFITTLFRTVSSLPFIFHLKTHCFIELSFMLYPREKTTIL